ncbi:non-functional NADPH-dependent codeinone reductase 2-like [Mercurialis annua]|uniref:non-functional NADPH-dependent codeinone reductase 2-like n=1 Tax=Mercurialis annua TaxID=3986 RepID=UPI00215F9CE0|nr:non-functional NADPH-dependent codeinone reductase 2-like [Mercurialis annua]
MAISIPEATIGSSGQKIPILGFGTADFPFGSSYEVVKESVINAIEAGYRHFDTAAAYQSEKPLGDAIAESLKLGLIRSRDELFITSKLFPSDAYPGLVIPALQQTLENLGLEYLDLYLIHFPASLKAGCGFPFEPEDIVAMDMEAVWKDMEEGQILGLTKSIGVSNFTCKKIEMLLSTARIPPAVNQVEINPLWQQEKLRKYCEKKGIHITAYSVLGGRGTPWGANKVMESEVLNQIASARGKTLPQVCLRWVYEQGVSLVVKSFNKERMKENLKIFEWKLNAEDLQKIDQIPQQRSCPTNHFVSENGPYKSLLELWDGEV